MTIEKIFLSVSSVFAVEVDAIKSPARTREISNARKAVVYFLRTYLKMGSGAIAKQIGRGHSVIDRLYREAEAHIETDIDFRSKINRIEQAGKLNELCCPKCGKVLD